MNTINLDSCELEMLNKLVKCKILSVKEAQEAKAFKNLKTSIRREMWTEKFKLSELREFVPDLDEHDPITLDCIQDPFKDLLARTANAELKLTDPVEAVRNQKGDFLYDAIEVRLENNTHPDHNGARAELFFFYKGKRLKEEDGVVEEDICELLDDPLSDSLFYNIKEHKVSFGDFLCCFSDEVIEMWKKNNIKFSGRMDDELSWNNLMDYISIDESQDN
jgi:hypothetical protein